MAVQPVIMPKLGAYTEDVLLAGWLVEEGEEVAAGAVVLRAGDRQDDGRGRGRDVRVVAPARRRRATRCRSGRRSGSSPRRARSTRRFSWQERDRRSRPRRGRSLQPVPRLHRPGRREAIAAVALAGRSGHEPSTAASRFPPATGRRDGTARLASRPRAPATSSASRSTTPARSPGRDPAGGSLDRDVAAWAEAQPAGGQPVARRRGEAVTVAADDPAARPARHDRHPHGLEPPALGAADLRARARREAARRAAGAPERGRGQRRGSGSPSIVVKLVAARPPRAPAPQRARDRDRRSSCSTEINVAVAVDTADGLVAPVVAGADRLSLEEINAPYHRSRGARAGRLTYA